MTKFFKKNCKKTEYFLAQIVQKIFSNAYKLHADTLNGFSDRIYWLFLQL